MEPRVWEAVGNIPKGDILSCQVKRRGEVHFRHKGNVGGGVGFMEDSGEHIGINSVGK